MPYRWTEGNRDDTTLRVTLWPHRSLPTRGFVAVIAGAAAVLALPLLPALGTPVLWGLLPFLLGTLALLWLAIRRNDADASLREELSLAPDRIELVRHNPRGPEQRWQANPYWVRLRLRPEGGPVPNYITLKGDGREVELGAFLSPEERAELHRRLAEALARLGPPPR